MSKKFVIILSALFASLTLAGCSSTASTLGKETAKAESSAQSEFVVDSSVSDTSLKAGTTSQLTDTKSNNPFEGVEFIVDYSSEGRYVKLGELGKLEFEFNINQTLSRDDLVLPSGDGIETTLQHFYVKYAAGEEPITHIRFTVSYDDSFTAKAGIRNLSLSCGDFFKKLPIHIYAEGEEPACIEMAEIEIGKYCFLHVQYNSEKNDNKLRLNRSCTSGEEIRFCFEGKYDPTENLRIFSSSGKEFSYLLRKAYVVYGDNSIYTILTAQLTAEKA